MSNSIVANYIHYAGVSDETINGKLLYDGADESKRGEYEDALLHFVKHTSVSNMTLYPNFEIGWLFGPSGYVASFPKNAPYSNDPFICPYFRVISFTEVTYSKQVIEFCMRPSSQELVRKCVPLESFVPPIVESDNEDSGWGCALGHDGCSIGLYTFSENVSGSDHTSIRLFIGVHSGLHHQALHKLMEHDFDMGRRNRDIAQRTSSGPGDTGGNIEIHTYGSEFAQGSAKARMLEVAKENNRRLAALYASLLNLTTIGHITSDNKLPYRQQTVEMASISADEKEIKKLRGEALKWWPRGAPIYSNTTIPYFREEPGNMTEEAKAIIPPVPIQGYPIGKDLWEVRSFLRSRSDTVTWDKLVQDHGLNFHDMPLSIDPIAESEYNTFRLEGDDVIWYSGCAPTKKLTGSKNSCVIRQLPLAHGYECTDSQIPHDAFDTCSSHLDPWTNHRLNGYPSIFQNSPAENRTHSITPDTENAFFSLYHGPNKMKRLIPTQLKYSLKRKPDMKNPQVKQDLLRVDKNQNQINMVPVIVYLSPEAPFNNSYNMRNEA